MAKVDFNLLVTLDAVLGEGNVARAAKRLRLSPSAMSRALARLRKTTGDPLLVRAGRGLVPTPRAMELREQARQLVEEVNGVLRPAEMLDVRRLERIFTMRVREGFVENFGAALIERIGREAPGVRLHFAQRTDKESTGLREGNVDLETGVVGGATGPEIRMQGLFRDRFVGVVRQGHGLAKGKVTWARYAQGKHICVSRRGLERGPIDEALKKLKTEREITTVVGSFSGALALARASDLIASVPERQTGNLREGMHSFELPFAMAEIKVSMLWHPRMDADPGHRWLRGVVREVCGRAGGGGERVG
jgi:DNA-binding transcriptional LysR family regulator